MPKNPFSSGQGHTGPTPEAPLYISKADQEQAEREAADKTPLGQEVFDRAMEQNHSYGRAEQVAGGMPEAILDYVPVDQRPLPKYSREAVREMFPPDFDSSSVPKQLALMYNLNRSTHEPVWDYADNHDGKGTSFEASHFANNPWDEYCLDKNGKKCFRDGLILFKRPIEIMNDIRARFNETGDKLKEEAPKGNPELNEHDPETKRKRDETSQAIQAMLANSPTKSMGQDNLDRAMATYKPEETEALANQSRPTWQQRALLENSRDETAEKLKASVGSRSTHFIGASFDSEGKLV